MTDQQTIEQFRQQADFAIDDFLEHQEHKKTTPYVFPLYASSIGRKKVWKVLARRLTIMDRASIAHLPDQIQNFVWNQLQSIQSDRERMQAAGETPKNIQEALANNDQNIRAANIYCHAGFVDPQIVLNQHEENRAERKLFVERIAAEDRIAFVIACNDAVSEQARLFETFHPGPASDARDRDAVPVAAEPVAGPWIGEGGN